MNPFQGEYAKALEAETAGDLQSTLVRFTRELEFETMAATTVIDRCGSEPRFVVLHNTPVAYLDTFEDRDHAKLDPVAQHCKGSNLPIVWDQSTYVRAGRPEFWEHQAQFGLRCGISLAIHLPKGLHFWVGIDRDKELAWGSGELESVLSRLYLFTVCAFETSRRLLDAGLFDHALPDITPRELEVLRWASAGKTAWETGRILSIAENTVNRHIANVCRKLECCGKRQAVVRAMQMGLI